MGTEVRSRVQFRVLGPLEVSLDGEPVRLSGGRQRALLALLALNANQLVSTERLVAELFGDEAAPGAANAVHVAVSRLRRVLPEGDAELLVTRPGGYVLALAPDQLDVLQFERLLAHGRQRLSDGDPGGAVATLREALGLWRGAPLSDLASVDFLDGEVRRLEELRLLALAERIEADLALGRHAELIAELEALVAAEPLQERPRRMLMLALYRADRRADALAVYREASAVLREQLGLGPSRALQDLEQMILRQDPSLGATAGGPALARAVCPFKGLACFDAADVEFFCGRERVVADLIARAAESRLVGILGPSGIGKSSLLRAGLLPALARGALPRSASWRQVLVRPGTHPCASLETAIGGGGLEATLARLGPSERIVIAVDQLEELFTSCNGEEERSEFLRRLAMASRDPERRVLVVCALRADFYGHLGSDAEFAELLSHGHVLVGPMDRDELSEAIERPAARAGLAIERPLVDALVAEVADAPGGLPLLSTSLLELWLARDGQTLRFAGYRETGGVRGAVGRLAEAAYAKLTEHERRAARNILLRLVSGEEGALSRRRVRLAELQQVDGGVPVLAALIDARLLTVGDGEVELSHEALLREWPRYRTWLDEDRLGRRLHAHLIAAAREWDARGRDPSELYRGGRLTSAMSWTGRNRSWLNPVEREFLEAAGRQADRDGARQRSARRRLRTLRLAAAALLLVAICAGAFALAKQRSATAAARAAAADARAALGRQLGAEAVNEPSLDLAMLLAREAVDLNRSSQTEGTLLTTLLRSRAVIGSFTLPAGSPGQLSLSPDGRTLAVANAATGSIAFYDTATRRRAGTALSGFGGDQAPVFSRDGTLMAYSTLADGEPRIAVRDTRTSSLKADLAPDARARGGRTGDIRDGSIAFGPAARSVDYVYWTEDVAGRAAGAYLDRWSLPSGRLVSATRIGSGPLLAVAAVDSGRRLLAVARRHLTVLDARTLRTVHSVAISPAPVAPAGAAVDAARDTVAIAARSGAVSFIDGVTGVARAGHDGHTGAVARLFFAGRAPTLAVVGADNMVTLWSSRAGAPVRTLTGPTGQVESAVATRDGTTLYTASLDGQVLAWDLTGARQFGRSVRVGAGAPCCSALGPHTPPLAVSPDGAQFAVRLRSSTVGLFSTASLRRLSTFTMPSSGEAITALAWSPTAPVLAVAGHAGLVQIWNVAGAPRLDRSLLGLHVLVGHPEAIQALAFSADGSLLAASDQRATRPAPNLPALPAAFLAIWRTGTGALVGAPRDLEVGSGSGRNDQLAFSTDGARLAAGLPDGRVLVLDPASGDVLQTLTPASGASSLAFAPDGTLATGTLAGTVDLWNPIIGQPVAPALIAASAPITSIAFEPDGQRFVTAGYRDGSVKLWFTSTLQQEGPALGVAPGAAASAAFGASRQVLLAAQDGGTISAWPTSLTAWEQRACLVAGRTLTRAEWSRLVAQPGYRAVCP